MNGSKTIFLGIAGGSGSGKTYLARRVHELVGSDIAALISMDQYFKPSEHTDPDDVNFDHPNHLDLDLLTDHIGKLQRGEAIKVPHYDFHTYRRTPDAVEIRPVPVVIVEGLFVLSSPVLDFLDLTCFLDVADDQRLLGRILRDLKEREGNIATVVQRYQRFVRPSYHVFVAPTRQNADVVVDFTYRRAFFTRLLAHIVKDYALGMVDLGKLIEELRSETYTLGYRADESIMPIGIDIRRLAEAYPESAFPKPGSDVPGLMLTSED